MTAASANSSRTPDALTLARGLLVAEMVAMLLSTSAAVGMEFIIYLTFVFSKELRRRLAASLSQPMVMGALAWALMLAVAALWSVGGTGAALESIAGWRKLLLLPLAAAVFEDEKWKRRMLLALTITAVIGVMLSFFSRVTEITIYKYPAGISIHNHATQGMVFAVCLFAMLIMMFSPKPATNRFRRLTAAAALATLANLILVTDGRSGYLALLVLTAVTGLYMARGKWRYILGIGLPLVISLLLALSPTARNRIRQGIDEALNYRKSPQLSSMGIRVSMWQHTARLIKEKPLLGYGTGGFDEAYRRLVEGETGWQNQPVGSPHNQFLRILAEQGAAGLLVFLAFLASIAVQKPPQPWRVLGLGVLAAWCATSMFSDHFSTFFEGRFIYLWCGAMLAGPGWRNSA